MYRGYIKLWRKTQDKGWYKNSKYVHLWVHILLKANHAPNELMWNGKIIIIGRGQFITGRDQLSKQTGIKPTTIRNILEFFEREHQIEQQKTSKFTIITIVKWKDYQESRQQNGQQMDNRRTADEQQMDTNKNDKNDKNDEHVIGDLVVAGVKEIMSIFYKNNPTLNWKNQTSRKAAADLINQFGLEETKEMAKAIVAVQGQSYAPTAVNPYEMREKLAKFKLYFDRQKNNQHKITKL